MSPSPNHRGEDQLAATRGTRRLLLAGAASALITGTGLLAPGLQQEAEALVKGIRVTLNPNGHGPHEVEGWVLHETPRSGPHTSGRKEWNRHWDPRSVGPDQQDTFDTDAHDLALLFSPGGGAEPFILAFSNPTFGRPDATVGNGTISHPKGPAYLTKYLDEKGLSEGESVTAYNNFSASSAATMTTAKIARSSSSPSARESGQSAQAKAGFRWS